MPFNHHNGLYPKIERAGLGGAFSSVRGPLPLASSANAHRAGRRGTAADWPTRHYSPCSRRVGQARGESLAKSPEVFCNVTRSMPVRCYGQNKYAILSCNKKELKMLK
jgi:hypothetical protein